MLFSPKQNNCNYSQNIQKKVCVRGVHPARTPFFWEFLLLVDTNNFLLKMVPASWRANDIRLPVWVWQGIRFGLVGVLNTGLDAGLYFLSVRSGLIPNFLFAKGFSYSIGVLNSFVWNKTWTFKSRLDSRRIFIPFVTVNLLAIGINVGVMYLALNALRLPEPGALALATGATFLWNFVVSKFLIFKDE